MKKLIAFLMMSLILMSCSKDPSLNEEMLGSGSIFDPSLYDPEKYLVSYAIPNPTPEQALKPVIIVSHGYTATTFEWDEFKDFTDSRGEVLISRVLLGGHGRNYEDFKNSTWKDWQSAIVEEYSRLVQAGFQNISFLGSSTSGALYLELLSDNFFADKPAPNQILLVDPIVIPSNKTLSMVHVFGPMLGFLEVDQSSEEDKVYYRYRPQETLVELQNLLNGVRKDLEKGIILPQGSSLKVYKSKMDPTADPVSAVLIYKGVKPYSGGNTDVQMIDSNLHVYTNLQLRSFTPKDKENQQATFIDILNRVQGM